MFSGIIEQTATVVAVRSERQNKHFILRADFCRELKIDQSIAHNGVCLTVVDLTEDTYTVTAMKETAAQQPGGVAGRRSDQRRAVDETRCAARRAYRAGACGSDGRLHGGRGCRGKLVFHLPLRTPGRQLYGREGFSGRQQVSLTVCDSRDDGFRVAIIPYTYEHTNFCRIGVGSVVNLEFDIVGKYIARLMRNYMKR